MRSVASCEDLERKAAWVRQQVLEMCAANGGHIASAYSCVEIMVALYYGGGLRLRRQGASWTEPDKFLLNKGHGETGLYAILADLNYFPKEWLVHTYRDGACLLGGHPSHCIPGVEITSGSLGHGLGIGAGMALAAQMDHRDQRIVVLLGDAECTEGSVWEAAMFAAQRNLGNLLAIVDRNGIGSLDFTKNYTSLSPLADKWRAFGWEVRGVDGHSFKELADALSPERSNDGRPCVRRSGDDKGQRAFVLGERSNVARAPPVSRGYHAREARTWLLGRRR